MTGSLFEPAARLRATSARLSSLNGAILYDVGLGSIASEVADKLAGVSRRRVTWRVGYVPNVWAGGGAPFVALLEDVGIFAVEVSADDFALYWATNFFFVPWPIFGGIPSI